MTLCIIQCHVHVLAEQSKFVRCHGPVTEENSVTVSLRLILSYSNWDSVLQLIYTQNILHGSFIGSLSKTLFFLITVVRHCHHGEA